MCLCICVLFVYKCPGMCVLKDEFMFVLLSVLYVCVHLGAFAFFCVLVYYVWMLMQDDNKPSR